MAVILWKKVEQMADKKFCDIKSSVTYGGLARRQ